MSDMHSCLYYRMFKRLFFSLLVILWSYFQEKFQIVTADYLLLRVGLKDFSRHFSATINYCVLALQMEVFNKYRTNPKKEKGNLNS